MLSLDGDESLEPLLIAEFKLLASQNHPNIASIHGFEDLDGVKALVLELVRGPGLAERIQEGPVPVEVWVLRAGCWTAHTL